MKEPRVIQGGMGVAISGWRLAQAVCRTGQLGVVSGTALDVVVARRLQDGDPGGHVRQALAAFPHREVADWILETYFVPGGIGPDELYRTMPRHTLSSPVRLLQLTAVASFVEVWLARQGHDGRVGINFLCKIELPLPAALYGAMLAGVDEVLVGAGNPAHVPGLVRGLTEHAAVTVDIQVLQSVSGENLGRMVFDPAEVFGADVAARFGPLKRPRVLAIVASNDLARILVRRESSRPDGFIVEGPSAGGHNAPPRGPRQLDEAGRPTYGTRDVVDVPALVDLGLPVWLAGSYGAPDRLTEALELGAVGVQVGTPFAYCAESGMEPQLREQALTALAGGDLSIHTDWRASPTGFPFHVAPLPQTWTDPETVQARKPVCDLGALRSAYRTESGEVGYRCPAEPTAAFLRKGGKEEDVEGRVCLCNALLATAGHPARRKGGVVEPPLVTSGNDLSGVVTLMQRPGVSASAPYRAADVVDYLLGA